MSHSPWMKHRSWSLLKPPTPLCAQTTQDATLMVMFGIVKMNKIFHQKAWQMSECILKTTLFSLWVHTLLWTILWAAIFLHRSSSFFCCCCCFSKFNVVLWTHVSNFINQLHHNEPSPYISKCSPAFKHLLDKNPLRKVTSWQNWLIL